MMEEMRGGRIRPVYAVFRKNGPNILGAIGPLILLSLLGCSFLGRFPVQWKTRSQLQQQQQQQKPKTQPAPIHWPSVWQQMPPLSKVKIHQGHSKKLVARVPREIFHLQRKFICNRQEVYHHMEGNRLRAFVSASHQRSKGGIHCLLQVTYEGGEKSFPLFRLIVKKFLFQEERLNVPKKHIQLTPENIARWKREVAIQKKVYASGVEGPYFRENFILPLSSVVTSPYGLKRIFNHSKGSWHSGTDFRAAVGVAIAAANRGKAVFVGGLFFNGKTVIIDHGMNIFTMYCHLSKISVEQGVMVDRGDPIGLAGATGRVTGPHLHWGVKVNHQWISGLPFVAEGI